MTETEVEINEIKSVDNKIPVLSLNELVIGNAEKAGAPNQAIREKNRLHGFPQCDAPRTRHLHPDCLCR